MKRLFDSTLRSTALALSLSLLAPSLTYASPKPVNPETIHDKIVKKGIGGWVCVEEANGIVLLGRITTIEEQAFGLQLQNYPEITVVKYADVVRLRNAGPSGKTVAILAGAAAGVAIVTAVLMHNAFENNKPTLPSEPPPPTFP